MIIEMFSPARFSMNLNFPIGHKSVAGLWTIISFHSKIVTPQVSAASMPRTQPLSVWVAIVLLPTSPSDPKARQETGKHKVLGMFTNDSLQLTHRQKWENKSKSFWQQGKILPARKFLIVLIVQTVKLPLSLRCVLCEQASLCNKPLNMRRGSIRAEIRLLLVTTWRHGTGGCMFSIKCFLEQ